MRWLTILFFVVSASCFSQELSELRLDYPKANLDEAITNTLHEKLASVSKDEHNTIAAYKGAIATLKAKFAKGFKNKKTFFKEGVELIEYAISQEPNNIEIRCLRLGVQENSPKIVGYKKDIEADKLFILNNYNTISDQEIRKFVKGYVLLSELFTDTEKQLF